MKAGRVCERCTQPFLALASRPTTICPDCHRGGIPSDQARALLAAARRERSRA